MSNDVLKGLRAFLSGPEPENDQDIISEYAKAHKALKLLNIGYVYDPALEWYRYLPPCPVAFERRVRRRINELTAPGWSGSDVGYGYMSAPSRYDILIHVGNWEASPCAQFEDSIARATGVRVMTIDELREQVNG